MVGENVRIIPLSRISTSFATRRRGSEAYDRLLPLLDDGPVVIDLDCAGAMPAAFLDALILRLVDSGHMGHVVFRTTNERSKDKLRRVGGLRGVDLFLHRDVGDPERLVPRLPDPLKVRHVT